MWDTVKKVFAAIGLFVGGIFISVATMITLFDSFFMGEANYWAMIIGKVITIAIAFGLGIWFGLKAGE